MPVTQTPLISRATLETHLEVGNTSALDDRLDAIIAAATLNIETFCRRHFTRQVFTELHNSRNTNNIQKNFFADSNFPSINLVSPQEIRLKAAPVDTGETFEVRFDSSGDRQFEASHVVPSDDYFFDADTGLLTIHLPMVNLRNSIQITYTAGYAEASGSLDASIPADLKLAAIQQSIFLYEKSKPSNVGLKAGKAQGSLRDQFTVEFATHGIAPTAINLLRGYIRTQTGRY